MDLIDLKNNLIDINLELKSLIETTQKMRYDKPTGFLYSEELGEWSMEKEGLGEILVHPLFYTYRCPELERIMLILNKTFKNNILDSELINFYQEFKTNLFLISQKLINLDREEEAKGFCYLTYEQIMNSTWFTYLHLYCIYFDNEIFFITSEDKELYISSIELLEFYQSKSIYTIWMLTEANEISDFKLPTPLIDILENNERINYFKQILKTSDRRQPSF